MQVWTQQKDYARQTAFEWLHSGMVWSNLEIAENKYKKERKGRLGHSKQNEAQAAYIYVHNARATHKFLSDG